MLLQDLDGVGREGDPAAPALGLGRLELEPVGLGLLDGTPDFQAARVEVHVAALSN
jgi:hypothetical protein